MTVRIHRTAPADRAGIVALYPKAFPEEDLVALVEGLLDGKAPGLSLTATTARDVVGHVWLSDCQIEPGGESAGLLGPLAVAPAFQGRGTGSRLVMEVLSRTEGRRVLVLGDPAYYSRFGFATETAVAPPYDLPQEWRSAWQGRGPDRRGTLSVPELWRRPELWLP